MPEISKIQLDQEYDIRDDQARSTLSQLQQKMDDYIPNGGGVH